jgi:hypothetical protein
LERLEQFNPFKQFNPDGTKQKILADNAKKFYRFS